MIEAAPTYHGMYVKLFEAHKTAPNIWTLQECTRIMTAIMAAKSFSWRVVGITPMALELFAENNYRRYRNAGITRAHLVPRIRTVEALLSKDNPYSQDEFLSRWISNDKTVICARGENRADVPRYISFPNVDGQLFSCANVLAGWRHTQQEQDFLRDLHHKHQNGEM